MRLGLSVTSLYSLNHQPKQMDGVGTYTQFLCKALLEKKIHVQEIYFKTLTDTFYQAAHKNTNLALHFNPLLPFISRKFSTSYKIDLLHVTDYMVPKLKGIPIVSTVHDAIMFNRSKWSNKSSGIKNIRNLLLLQMSKRAQSFITVSHSAKAELIEFWKIPEEKISVIYHGIGKEWYEHTGNIATQTILKKYNITKPFFLTVGTLQPRKNLNRIINAYLSLPNSMGNHFDFVIVGKMHPSLTSSQLINEIQLLEQKKQIRWLQYIPVADLRCLYQNAHLVLYPSLAEGFGFPIIEAFASGAPVITSNFGATAEISGESAYLVDPYSEEAIQAGIIEIVENQSLRQQLIKKGHARAELFTWEKCAEETIAVYNQLL